MAEDKTDDDPNGAKRKTAGGGKKAAKKTGKKARAQSSASNPSGAVTAGASRRELTTEIPAAGTLERMKKATPPTKRAAYSDRVAAKMAALAQLAYEPLDEEQRNGFTDAAKLLLEIKELGPLEEKLREVMAILHNPAVHYNDRLRRALDLGGFELETVLFSHQSFLGRAFSLLGKETNKRHDTQGFVAVRKPDPDTKGDPGMLVVCFRGTQQASDWVTNFDIRSDKVYHSKDHTQEIGTLHRGFHEAYLSVRDALWSAVEKHPELPIFVTGHSLGGALATIATWYLPGSRLAACYTFGAPRPVDQRLARRFRTPVYRIVNGLDPVPFVPISGVATTGLEHLFDFLGKFVPILREAVPLIQKLQLFEHPGDQRYLQIATRNADGTYPKFLLQRNVGSLHRVFRALFPPTRWLRVRKRTRIAEFHSMDIYRRKLEAYSVWRKNGEV